MYYLGNNTGNLVFTTGLETYLRCNNTKISNPTDESIGVDIISCSNGLNGGILIFFYKAAA
jgi:hypothetical protein